MSSSCGRSLLGATVRLQHTYFDRWPQLLLTMWAIYRSYSYSMQRKYICMKLSCGLVELLVFGQFVVPPRMTFLLQPLDTHVFAVYKWRLLQAYQRARVASGSEGGDLDIAEFLPCVYEAISLSMERGCWAHAFSQDGFGRRQAALCASVRSQLGLEHAVDVDATRPTDAQVSLCFPRKFNVRLGLFWSLFDDRVPSASGEGQRSAASSGSSGGVPAASRGAASSSSSAAAARRPGSDSSIREPRTRAEHRAAKAAAKARCSGSGGSP